MSNHTYWLVEIFESDEYLISRTLYYDKKDAQADAEARVLGREGLTLSYNLVPLKVRHKKYGKR